MKVLFCPPFSSPVYFLLYVTKTISFLFKEQRHILSLKALEDSTVLKSSDSGFNTMS